MKSVDELKCLNEAYKIFERHRLDSALFPIQDSKEFYIVRKDTVYDIIRDLVEHFSDNHPLWNFGKFPHEKQ